MLALKQEGPASGREKGRRKGLSGVEERGSKLRDIRYPSFLGNTGSESGRRIEESQHRHTDDAEVCHFVHQLSVMGVEIDCGNDPELGFC